MAVDPWEEALKEAYVAAPADKVILSTIELRHSTFLDDQDNPIAIRIVRDYGTFQSEGEKNQPDIYGHMLTLESDAPLDASQSVLFQSMMFNFKLPEQADARTPSLELSLDNVTGLVSNYLDAAINERSSMELTYREYIADDVTAPVLVMSNLSIKMITSTTYRVTGVALFTDLINEKFPDKDYRVDEYPGLQQ